MRSTAQIRSATSADVPAMLEIYGPLVRDTVISFEEQVPSVSEFEARLNKSHLWLISEDETGVTGYAYAAPFHARAAYRWSVEVSVYLRSDRLGRGLGRTLITTLLDRLRSQGFVNAFAGVALPNDASVKLFESMGFERIALQKEVGFKQGRWVDVGWWQKHLRERSSTPPEPAV